jgi:hypothetical protein
MRIFPSLPIIVALSSVVAIADIVPIPGAQRIKPVFEASDLVCYCYVQSVAVSADPLPAQSSKTERVRQRSKLTVEIRDAYKEKGQGQPVVIVQNDRELAIASASYSYFQRGDIYLLFLKSTSAGIYELSDRFLGATHFRSLSQQPGEMGLEKLQSALVTVLQQPNRDDRLNALRLLQGFDILGERSLSRVELLCSSEDSEIAFTALAVLLKSKTPEGVENLKRYLEIYKGDAEPLALVTIGTQLGRLSDAKMLPQMEALSGSKYVSVRLGAMDAIRKIKSSESAPTLVKRLDDPDSTVQYVALITLAEILGRYDGDFAPSMYLFDKKPQYYIGLWKQWWAEEGSKLYPSASGPK